MIIQIGENMKVKTIELNCKRCQHKWHPRKGEVMVCPKCHSPYWNREATIKREVKQCQQ